MATLLQTCAPIHAAAQARQGDARALLAIPDGRREVTRLLAGDKPYHWWQRPADCTGASISDLAGRKTIAAAKELLAARQLRREARLVAEQARKGKPGRYQQQAALRRLPANQAARLIEGLATKKYTAGRLRRELKGRPEAIEAVASRSIETLVSLIGAIGDQARSDIAREFGMGVGRDRYKAGRYHYFEATNLHRVEVRPDWTAALVTMRDFVSFGYGSDSGRGHDTTRGCSFRCYLVVRDTTTRDAHVLRVPPKFGNESTKFYGTFASPRDRIQAAVAWTFEMEPAEYAPALEA